MSLIFLIYPVDGGRILYVVYLSLLRGHSHGMTFLHFKVYMLADAIFPLVQFEHSSMAMLKTIMCGHLHVMTFL